MESMFTKKQVFGVIIAILAVFLVAKMSGLMGNEMDRVKLTTNKGEIVIELYENTPITSENFKKLVSEGFYDGTKFHRVIEDFMIQGGDPLSKDDSKKDLWGTGGSETIEDEHVQGSTNLRGTISMANAGPNSGSSQFFINLVDNTFLDWDKEPLSSKHPVFGKVVEGMDVVDLIGKVQVDGSDKPLESIVVLKAEVL